VAFPLDPAGRGEAGRGVHISIPNPSFILSEPLPYLSCSLFLTCTLGIGRLVGEALWYGSVGKRYVPGGERSRELLQFVV